MHNFKNLIFLNWGIVALQCCVNVCSTTKWISYAAAKSLQSCPTLCDPIDSSPPGSPIPGILQARTLEWVAISFSNAWKWKVKVKSLSRVRLFETPWTAAYQAPPSLGFSRQEHWSGLPFPSAMHESEKWKWSCSVLSDSQRPHRLQPTRLLRPWDFPGKSTGMGQVVWIYGKYQRARESNIFTNGRELKDFLF